MEIASLLIALISLCVSIFNMFSVRRQDRYRVYLQFDKMRECVLHHHTVQPIIEFNHTGNYYFHDMDAMFLTDYSFDVFTDYEELIKELRENHNASNPIWKFQRKHLFYIDSIRDYKRLSQWVFSLPFFKQNTKISVFFDKYLIAEEKLFDCALWLDEYHNSDVYENCIDVNAVKKQNFEDFKIEQRVKECNDAAKALYEYCKSIEKWKPFLL